MKLCIPKQILEQHLVVLGKTGSGKSSALRHIVEYLLDHKKRVCVIDPKGDWSGVKTSADGQSAGYPVIAFGDFKKSEAQDVPINDRSGKHVAELITSGNRPCLIGFRGWMPGAMTQFWIDFASTLFNANSGELYLVGDEFHNFAPKGKIMDPQAGKCLHWSNRMLSEGRGIGLVCLIASQRPQKVHNDTLTSCETLVAMRVIHKADRDAVKAWIDGCGDGSSGAEVLNSLAGMSRGEAFVWSPEIGFGPKRLTFPMFATFDSFAPPQLQKKIGDAGWADIDLATVKEKLAAVIEETKQNDPKELRRKIGELSRQLADARNARPAPVATTIQQKRVEVPVLKESQITRLEKLADKFDNQRHRSAQTLVDALQLVRECFEPIVPQFAAIAQQLRSVHAAPQPATLINSRPPMQNRVPRHPNGEHEANTTVSEGYIESLVHVLVNRHPVPTPRAQLAGLAGKSTKSSAFGPNLREMQRRRLAEDTEQGFVATALAVNQYAGDRSAPVLGDAALQHWLGRLPRYESRLLRELANVFPNTLTKDGLAEAAEKSLTSSAFGPALRNLIKLSFVTEDAGEYRAAEFFFEGAVV